MAANPINLDATTREGNPRAVRGAEKIPAVVYGHGIESENIAVDTKTFSKVYAAAGHTSLVDLKVNDKEHNVLIKEVQQHPLRDQVLHIDFYQVRMDEKVKAEVSLTFTGQAPAEKDLGGVFLRNIDTVEVEALPKDLPREIIVDISGLAEYDDAVRITDLQLPEGVALTSDSDAVVCLVQAPRTEEEISELEEEVAEDVEGVEGVSEEKAEGEEGETAAEGETEEAKKEEAGDKEG